jgi:hypothetical protein
LASFCNYHHDLIRARVDVSARILKGAPRSSSRAASIRRGMVLRERGRREQRQQSDNNRNNLEFFQGVL